MDFDLFELDEDDDILRSVLLEPTQQQSEPLHGSNSDLLPEFQCSGEDSIKNKNFTAESFVGTKFLNTLEKTNDIFNHISLTPYSFGAKEICARSITQYLFADTFINIQHLVAGVQGAPLGNFRENADLNFYQRRQHVTQLLRLVLFTTKTEQWPVLSQHLTHLRNLINSISTNGIWKSIYFASSCKGNDCNLPTYHLLHGILEWKFLDLCILFKFEVKNAIAPNKQIFRVQLERIIDDVLVCALLFYAKKRTAELLFASPFSCTCVKEFWLLLQLILNQWGSSDGEQISFWTLFNEAMSRVKLKIDQFSTNPLAYYEFSTWLLQALIKLHGYRSNGQYEGSKYSRSVAETAENYDFIEQCTHQFLNAQPNEEQLRIHICMLTPILLEWWRPRFSISMIMWEHFHKRLNSAFYAPGAVLTDLAVACGSGRAYLERYRTLLAKFNNPADANLSSYTLFTLLLGKCLDRMRTTPGCGNQSQKLLGRIFSKFSLQKFLALNETGIHHLVELFLILALCGDFEELLPKLRDKLLAISLDKVPTKRQIAVVKGHMALLLLSAEHRFELADYVTKLLQQLNSVRNDTAVSKIIADGLLDIFKHYDKNFPRGEHLLIDAWLPSLLQSCTPVEQERTLEALHLMFKKFATSDVGSTDFLLNNSKHSHHDMLQALQTHVLPFVKQQYTTSFSDRLPQLAADFCLNADNSTKLLSFFVEAQTVSRQVLPQFLLTFLAASDGRPLLVDPAVLMHVWLKSLVLLTAQDAIVVQLTKYVIQLPAFSELTNISTPTEISQAKEPLCVFVAAVGKAYDGANFQRRCEIADQFNAYVRNFDKWLHQCNTAESKQIEQQLEVTFRFYSFLAIVVYNCPHIAYAKSKTNCFFHIAITRFILPPSIQMGKPPEGKLAQLVHKIWPVLVQGIGRLNFKTDAYIQKTLNDLIQKWTPFFKSISQNPKIVSRPFITCLLSDNQTLSLYVCERLTSLFLATQRRQADPNACLVISIFQEIVAAITTQDVDKQNSLELTVERLETFMKGTMLLTLEHIMMVDEVVPSRTMLLEVFRRLLCSFAFRSSHKLQQLFLEYLRFITKKHLAYYTFFYFELLMKLAEMSYELISNILDFLLDEICIVEQKRGAGEDNRIRSCYQQLKQCIENEKRKH